MEPILRAVGVDFPWTRRRTTLFHPSNHLLVAEVAEEVVGYVDWCDDLKDPRDLYLSSIQVEAAHRGGVLLGLLLANLGVHLRARPFRTIRTNIQTSNLRMIAIARKLGFTLEEDPRSPTTLRVFAGRELLDSPRWRRLSGRA